VFTKLMVAADLVRARSLPRLFARTAPRLPQRQLGRYFGRRRPEDGRIDEHSSLADAHNLVRP
jgi:methionyl-tRNA formyltransferase